MGRGTIDEVRSDSGAEVVMLRPLTVQQVCESARRYNAEMLASPPIVKVREGEFKTRPKGHGWISTVGQTAILPGAEVYLMVNQRSWLRGRLFWNEGDFQTEFAFVPAGTNREIRVGLPLEAILRVPARRTKSVKPLR